MSLVRRVRREAAAMKPPHGAPCNRCGVCCEASLCGLAAHVLGMQKEAGPCPALAGDPGSAACGLVSDPAAWMPIRVAAYGAEAMGVAAALLINAGDGCDARINGEPTDAAFNVRLAGLDEARKLELDRARQLWGQS